MPSPVVFMGEKTNLFLYLQPQRSTDPRFQKNMQLRKYVLKKKTTSSTKFWMSDLMADALVTDALLG